MRELPPEDQLNDEERRILQHIRENLDVDGMIAAAAEVGWVRTRGEIEAEALGVYRFTQLVQEGSPALELMGDRADTKLRFFEILTPHMAAGRSWEDILGRCSIEELRQIEDLLDGQTVEEFLS